MHYSDIIFMQYSEQKRQMSKKNECTFNVKFAIKCFGDKRRKKTENVVHYQEYK